MYMLHNFTKLIGILVVTLFHVLCLYALCMTLAFKDVAELKEKLSIAKKEWENMAKYSLRGYLLSHAYYPQILSNIWSPQLFSFYYLIDLWNWDSLDTTISLACVSFV